MKWTTEQATALDAVAAWFKTGDQPYFRLDGYAGSGKTTLAKHFAESCGKRVYFGAFTGKAASVLRKKGCSNATTIHSLIYKPTGGNMSRRLEELEGLITAELADKPCDMKKVAQWRLELDDAKTKNRSGFSLQSDPEIKNAEVVIVDESSMIDVRMARDLLSFRVPIIFLGDPGQLPPVNGKSFLAANKPTFFLEEIHRQAAESPIIQLATEYRQGIEPVARETDGVIIRPKAQLDWSVLANAGQVICGKNKTRRSINKRLRKMRGFDNIFPEPDDKLICLNNNHELGLLNGVAATANARGTLKGKRLELSLSYEDSSMTLDVDPGYFEETYGERTMFPRRESVEHFDYGYAITGHKSQGSQWPSVVICDDRLQAHDGSFRKKWLYTVATRAEENLIVYT